MESEKKVSQEGAEQVQETGSADNAAQENGVAPSLQAEATAQQDVAWKEQYVRLAADFQNYKRRIEKEQSSWISSAKIMVLKELLPIYDELTLALKAAQQQQDATDALCKWIEGMRITISHFKKRLESLGVTEIDCSGHFDPQYHEAIAHVDSPEKSNGDIVEVFSPGFMFQGLVIRHAQVSVAK